jgi:hypothetical protein
VCSHCEFVIFFASTWEKRHRLFVSHSFRIFFIWPGEGSERGIIFCGHTILSIHQWGELDPASMASLGVPAADWDFLPNDHNASLVYFVGPVAALRLLRLAFHVCAGDCGAFLASRLKSGATVITLIMKLMIRGVVATDNAL